MSGQRLVPALATLSLHGAAAALLLLGLPGLNLSPELKPQPTVIHAKLVIDQIPPKAVPKPKPAPPVKKPEPKPESKPEPKPVAKPKPEPKPAPKPSPAEKPKGPSPEEIKQREAEKKAAEAARQRALQEEILRKQEEELAAALAAEEEVVDEAEQVSSYQQLISALVQSNWSRPPTARNGMVAVVGIETLPTGEISNQYIVESSGNEAFDLSVLRAVSGLERIDELRELANTNRAAYERNFRRFRFKFQPTDLRR